MPFHTIGYGRLIDKYGLRARSLPVLAIIDPAIHGRTLTSGTDQSLLRFQPSYMPPDTLIGDLQFALRYEGINLEVLALLFARIGQAEPQAWLAQSPESAYARRIGFLYEWLTGEALDVHVPSRASYVPVLDEQLQFGWRAGQRNTRFRTIDNLPGTRKFCPLVRKTERLKDMLAKDLRQKTQDTLAKYPSDLLRRAAQFLYLKETHSSFEVEREKPSPDRARRFADLLHEAEAGAPLSEDRFVELQNVVVEWRFREASYRTQQNWIGDDLGYRKRVAAVPPRPENVRDLMEGLVELSERLRRFPDSIDSVIAAAALSFGFVFIHPFLDGNGRLHRYLIHEVLSAGGFTPKNIILPVSAVILANLPKYIEVLEAFSKPMMALTLYDPDVPDAPATGNDATYFRYFDATDQVMFLYHALERTVEKDLDEEISFLLGFDKARQALTGLIDWPAHALDLFIRVVHRNGGKLSRGKFKSDFSWMTAVEVQQFEAIVAESFSRDEARDPTSIPVT